MPSYRREQDDFIGEDITPTKDGCLLKEIVRESSDDEIPLFDDKVFIHWTGSLIDGTVFDNSRDRGDKVTFNLSRGEVLKAWDIGVATMKRGEIARFFAKPKYAYGLKGLPGKVESATNVIFEIELFDCIGKDLSEERDGSILRRMIQKGSGYEQLNEDSTVELSLKGKHQGQVFDERTVTFFGGAGSAENIPFGVERAVSRMNKGDRCKIYLNGKGTRGLDKFHIPLESPVEYEVTMIKLERAKEERQLTDDQKLEQSEILKQRGDDFVKGGYYELATKRYKTVFNYLLNATLRSERDRQRSWELKFAAQSNLALCYLKLCDYDQCKRACTSALAFDKKHEKSLFRRGQAQLASNNFELAITDFEAVLDANPSNLVAQQQIEECQQQIKQHKVKQKEMYNSFFKKPVKTNAVVTVDQTETNMKENEILTESN